MTTLAPPKMRYQLKLNFLFMSAIFLLTGRLAKHRAVFKALIDLDLRSGIDPWPPELHAVKSSILWSVIAKEQRGVEIYVISKCTGTSSFLVAESEPAFCRPVLIGS